MKVAVMLLALVLTAPAVYIVVQQFRRAGRCESLRRRFTAGTSFSQRRRFAKLARAGEPIERAEDADKVKQLLEWHRAMHAMSLSPEVLRGLVVALILLAVAGVLLQAAAGEAVGAAPFLIDLLFPLAIIAVLTLGLRRMHEKHEETVRANGWNLEFRPHPGEEA